MELSPRNFGILMHKAFENADDEEQIRLAVERMQADGTLSAAEAAALRRMIARALEHPAAREWFAGDWERVRNENEIIIPGGSSARRPDRVMIRGTWTTSSAAANPNATAVRCANTSPCCGRWATPKPRGICGT